MAKRNKQNRINLLTNIVTLVANMLVALYYTPYLVEKLGIATYGILPLALIVNQYINVATGMLTNSFTRFYSIAIQKKDYEDASRVLSTSIVVVLAIILLISPLLAYVVICADNVFNIPRNLIRESQLLFSFTIISFYLSLISSFLNVTLYALNRLDILNYLRIARQILKLLLVIVFFESLSVNLPFVGLANLATELIVMFISIYYFFRFKPREVHTRYSYINKATMTTILGMSLWVLLQECGDTFLYRTDNILINYWLGSVASGRVGAMSELGSYIKAVVQILGSIYGPLILIAYSANNHKEVQALAVTQTNVVGSLSSIMCGVIAGVSAELLSIWLDNSFVPYSHWLILKLIPVPFFAAGGIMSFVYRAWNKVKKPAIWTLLIGIVDIAILLPICKFSPDYLAEKVLIISGILSIIQSFLLGIIIFLKIYPECKKTMIPVIVKITFTFVASYFTTYLIKQFITIDGVYELLGIMVLSGFVSLFVLYFIIFNKEDRKSIFMVLK